MVYGIDGTSLNAIYNMDGTGISIAYDVENNIVFALADSLIVMTYNYQWCTKINSQLTMQQAIISEYEPDIIGLQEAAANNKSSNVFPSLADQFLSGYEKRLSTECTNRNGIASKIPFTDLQTIKYAQNDDEDWDYQKCYITLPSGRKIAWYNTHLTWKHDDETYLRKYAQAQELLADAETERLSTPYIIITGDFNMYGLDDESANYIGVGKPFADAGYVLVNWNDDAGFVKTYTGQTAPASLSDFTYPCDNIIVTPNIDVVNVTFDLTKLSYLDGNPIDHIPIIAELQIG